MEVRRERQRIIAVVIMALFLLIVLVSGCALKGNFGNTMETEKFQQGSKGKDGTNGSTVEGQVVGSNGVEGKDKPTSTNNGTGTASEEGKNAESSNKTDDNGQPSTEEQTGSKNGEQATDNAGEAGTDNGTKGNDTPNSESNTAEQSTSNEPSTKPNTGEQQEGNGTNTNGSEGVIGKDKPTVDGTKPSNKKIVALTFDDGPDTKYTPAILDILQEKGVPATFFVVGTQVSKYHDVMKRIVDEGHGLGNHSLSHKDFTKLSKKELKEQIEKTDQLIKDAVGFYPNEIRAPYGALNKNIREMFKANNREHVAWTVDTRDWAGTSIKEMREMIRTETKDRGIILMHSFGGKHIQNTVDMLADVIDDLQKLDFSFVTIEQLLEQ